MPGDRLFVAPETGERPGARRTRIGHRLQGRKGFRRDDKQGLRRVEVAHRFGEIGAVDIGNEAKSHRALAVMLERLISHDRTEIGAADADIDNVADALAGMAPPVAASDAVG